MFASLILNCITLGRRSWARFFTSRNYIPAPGNTPFVPEVPPEVVLEFEPEVVLGVAPEVVPAVSPEITPVVAETAHVVASDAPVVTEGPAVVPDVAPVLTQTPPPSLRSELLYPDVAVRKFPARFSKFRIRK